MRRRPISLILCSLLFLYYPGNWAWYAWNGRPIFIGDIIFSVVLPSLLLIGLIRVVKIGWYTLIAFGFLWGARDLYIYYSSQGASLAPILIHIFIYLLSLSYFINPRVRHLYFDPRLHWWKTKQRFETHSPAVIKHKDNWIYPIIRNISEGGCFLEVPHNMAVNDGIDISIPLPVPLKVAVIKAVGEVRWVSNDPLRMGLGVQFKSLAKDQTRALKQFVKRQL